MHTTSKTNPLLEKCSEQLTRLPNIQVNFKEAPKIWSDESIAGLLTITSNTNSIDYICIILESLTEEDLFLTTYQSISEQNKKYKHIIITTYLTNSMVEFLLKQNIEFIDATGNIYLNSQAAYVFIRAGLDSKNNASLFQITSTTLQIIYILLKSPSILEASLEELEKASSVPLEVIQNNLENLYYLGYLERKRKGGYWIANYTRLLARWEMGYIECLRQELLLGTFTFQQKRKFSEVAPSIIELALYDNFLIGGELGAAIATDYLYPQSTIIHITGNYKSVINKLNLIPSSQGEIIFLQQFGNQNGFSDNQIKNIADPLLIHAELIKENNDRLNSTANRLFDKYIEDRRQNA